MNNLWTLFGFSIIFYLLGSINGNVADWQTDISEPLHEQQLHILKMEYENLKLRQENDNMKTERKLERIEDHLTKLDQQLASLISKHDNMRTERKLERIEDHLTKLDQQLTSLISKHESVNISAAANNNSNTLEDAGKKDMSIGEILLNKIENIVQSLDMNVTLNMLQDIQSTLAKIENKYSTEEEQAMLNLSSKDRPMTCTRNVDNKLECSDVNLPTNCANSSNCFTNSCRIHNRLLGTGSFMVPCNHTTDGGGWTVIQRRVDDSVDFYRDWSEYKTGFGDLDGNYWIGLDKLHALTTTLAPVELRIEMKDVSKNVNYAKYDSFRIGDESTKYILQTVGVYSGTAGDAFSRHKGYKFSTRDQNNDDNKRSNCPHANQEPWWVGDCYPCNLNGRYSDVLRNDPNGIYWELDFERSSFSLKFVQMMIRPRKL